MFSPNLSLGKCLCEEQGVIIVEKLKEVTETETEMESLSCDFFTAGCMVGPTPGK